MDPLRPQNPAESDVSAVGFGERLKQEREKRDQPLEQLATTTRIGLPFLQALERNDFDGLPGPRAFGKLYIRAYAEVLGFDPAPLIAQYDRERLEREKLNAPQDDEQEPERKRRITFTPREQPRPAVDELRDLIEAHPQPEVEESAPEVEVEVEAEAEAEAEPVMPVAVAPQQSGWRRNVVVAAVIVAAILLVWAWFGMRSSAEPISRPETIPPASSAPAATVEVPQAAPVVEEPAPASGPLSVSEFGVGTSVDGRQLRGRSDRFKEGAVVWFSTRVLGGVSGQTVQHVWLRDGRRMQTTRLKLGGAHWRTFSRKTLWGTGDWAVEARDEDGNVLARSTFICLER